jgi:hypothetical protein
MPAEERKPGPGPHLTSDMRDIAATALWICLLKSATPVQEPHLTTDMRDIAATALWICLLKSPSPVRGRMSRKIRVTALCICLLKRPRPVRGRTLDMPAEAPKAGPRPDVPEDMRDIAATALWICLLESPSPVRGRMPPQICVISPPRHSGYACWKAQVRCEARMSPQMRDIAATALWICLLGSPSPVRGRMSRQICEISPPRDSGYAC